MKTVSLLARTLESIDFARGSSDEILKRTPADIYLLGASINPSAAGVDRDKLCALAKRRSVYAYFRVFDIPERYADSHYFFRHVWRICERENLWLREYATGRIITYFPGFGSGRLVNHCLLTDALIDELLSYTETDEWSLFGLHLDNVFLEYASWMDRIGSAPASDLRDYDEATWKEMALKLVDRVRARRSATHVINGESWRLDLDGATVHYENADVSAQDGHLGRVGWTDTLGRWLQTKERGPWLGLSGGPDEKQQGALRAWAQEGGVLHAKLDSTADAAHRIRSERSESS